MNRLVFIGVLVLGLSACGTSPTERAVTGGAMGAGAGGLLGGWPGAAIGGGAGALGGAVTAPDRCNGYRC